LSISSRCDPLLDFAEQPRGRRLVLVDLHNPQQGILRLVNLSSIQKQGYLLHFLADQILFQLSL